jgi:hypothetical protein
MSLHIFDLFSEMIETLPAKAILHALDLECKMLEEDMDRNRLNLPEDAFSILCFRQFVLMSMLGEVILCVEPLPSDHIEFYKETIGRLVQAGELPAVTMDNFDDAFSSVA